MTSMPTVTDEVAWISDPLAASPTFTTISTNRLVTGNTRRVLGQAGLMQGVYNNQDDALNPWNTMSPWYGNLLTANQASVEIGAPSSSEWAALVNCNIARTSAVAAEGSFSIALTSLAAGDMGIATPNGTSGFATAVVAGASYTGIAHVRPNTVARVCRIDFDWYNGAGSFISTTTGGGVFEASGWNLVATTGVSPTGAAYVQMKVIVAATAAAGEVHQADQFSFSASPSLTWLPGGQGGLLQPMKKIRRRATWAGVTYDLFTGHIEKFAAEWPFSTYGDMSIEAVDMFKVLTLSKTAGSGFNDAVMADTPTAYYKLGEGANGATSGFQPAAADSSGNGNTAQYYGSPGFGAVGALPAEAGTAVDFGVRTTYVLTPASANPHGTDDFTMQCWVYPRSLPTVDFADRIWEGNSADVVILSIKADGKLRMVVRGGSDGGLIESSVGLTPLRWTHVEFVKSGRVGPAAGAWKLYVNGVDVTTGAIVDGTGDCNLGALDTSIIGGKVAGGVIVPAFDGIIDEFAIFATTALSGARVAAHYAAALGFNANSLAGARIGNMLDLASIPAGDRNLDTGQFQMQPVREPMYDTPPLAYMLKLVDSEGWPAALFVSGDGKLTFQDRAHATPASSATFSDAGPLYYDAGVGPTRSDDGYWNATAYQADGGAPQTAVVTPKPSLLRTGTTTGLLNASDADVATMGATDLARFSVYRDRVDRVVLHPIDDPTNMWPVVLGLELNDRISVVRTSFPGGGSTLTLDVRITGIEHQITEEDWHTILTVEPT